MGEAVVDPMVEGEDEAGVEADMVIMKEIIVETMKETIKVSKSMHTCLLVYTVTLYT